MRDIRPIVAVVGDAELPPRSPKGRLAGEVGRRLVEGGFRVLTGGLGGAMEAASRGARRSPCHRPGDVIGILPSFDPATANPYVDVAIPTGLDLGRSLLVAQASAVVAVGGGAGTLSEIAFAWTLRRLIVALRVSGWSGKLADERLDDRVRYPDLPDDRVYGADTAAEAVRIVRRLLPVYTRRHRSIPGRRR
jgi:uncharacterized protein (TIGR00725 family)